MKPQGKTELVTGATDFVGGALTLRLAADGGRHCPLGRCHHLDAVLLAGGVD